MRFHSKKMTFFCKGNGMVSETETVRFWGRNGTVAQEKRYSKAKEAVQ